MAAAARSTLACAGASNPACSESLPDKTPKRVQSKAWDGCRALRARGELITHRNEDFQLQVLEDLILRMDNGRVSSGQLWRFWAPEVDSQLTPCEDGVKKCGAIQSNAPGRRWAGRKNSHADPPFLSFLRLRSSPSRLIKMSLCFSESSSTGDSGATSASPPGTGNPQLCSEQGSGCGACNARSRELQRTPWFRFSAWRGSGWVPAHVATLGPAVVSCGSDGQSGCTTWSYQATRLLQTLR